MFDAMRLASSLVDELGRFVSLVLNRLVVWVGLWLNIVFAEWLAFPKLRQALPKLSSPLSLPLASPARGNALRLLDILR